MSKSLPLVVANGHPCPVRAPRTGFSSTVEGKIGMKHVLLALCLMVPGLALAVPVQVSWNLPTARVDGTPLPVSELAKTTVEWGTCGTDTIAVVEGSQDAAAPATTLTFDHAAGQICVRAKVTDTQNRVSDWSGTVMAVIESDSPPNAPVILQITLLPLPQPESYVAYSDKGYRNTKVAILLDGALLDAPGSNLVAVGSPCNCSIAKLDTAGAVWCSVGGQIQVANNSGTNGGVAKGSAFPDEYVATCRATG